MTPYEQYLLNDFKPYTIENNPFEAGSDRTKGTPPMNVQPQIQGELANKPVYNARGERSGSTLSDDMFDIKNKRRGNPETSKHPFVGGIGEYTRKQILPTLSSEDYAPEVPEETAPVMSAVEQYLMNHPYLAGNDFRDNAISRKKNVGEGEADLYAYQKPNEMTDTDWAYEDPDYFVDPDYGNYLIDANEYRILQERINELQGKESGYGKGDSIRDDMKYIKSGGKTYHGEGYEEPSYGLEYDKDPVFHYNPDVSWGFHLNPDRLSPATAEIIAKSIPKDRIEYEDYWGDKTGLNPVINEYRRLLGLTPVTPSGGAYMQGIY